MDVKIVWGGWSCAKGYIDWAYVCDVKEVPQNMKGVVDEGFKAEDIMSIGKRLFEAPNSLNGEKDKPVDVCKQWVKDQKHDLIGYVKMRTD